MSNVPRIEAIDADSTVAICCDVLAFIQLAARAAAASEADLGNTDSDAWHGWPRYYPTPLPKWRSARHKRGSSNPLAAHEPGAARAPHVGGRGDPDRPGRARRRAPGRSAAPGVQRFSPSAGPPCAVSRAASASKVSTAQVRNIQEVGRSVVRTYVEAGCPAVCRLGCQSVQSIGSALSESEV